MALRALVKTELKHLPDKSSITQLYRSIVKELPRVLIIYDIDMPHEDAKQAINFHFRKHSHIQDKTVIDILLAKGYMELEETLMQWKQKTHLLRILEPMELEKKRNPTLTVREQLALGMDV